jgi:hypothetical protein
MIQSQSSLLILLLIAAAATADDVHDYCTAAIAAGAASAMRWMC